MKEVILSADGPCSIYLVPAEVADHLRAYCMEFCNDWLPHSADAEKYRMHGGLSYDETAFIDYLNRCKFPDCPSKFVRSLPSGINPRRDFLEIPWFNF